MLTTPLLSLGGKLRLLAEPLIPPRQSLEAERSERVAIDESVASFVSRRLGREVFERLVQPLLAGIYTADPAKLSMGATMPEFLDFERRYGSLLRATLSGRRTAQSPSNQTASGARYGMFVAPERGMETLISALAERLPSRSLQLNTHVSALEFTRDARWRLAHSHSTEMESFDAVVVALPAHAAALLLERNSASLARELSAIPYAGCAVVSLGFHDPELVRSIKSFGFVVPRVERRQIIAASFASAKFPGRAPEGSILIRTFVGGALDPQLVDLPDDALRTMVVDELRELLAIRAEPIMVDIARWPSSMPQYHVGHTERVARIERLIEELPGLALAGNAYRGVGIPQCIHSGEQAAERVASAWA